MSGEAPEVLSALIIGPRGRVVNPQKVPGCHLQHTSLVSIVDPYCNSTLTYSASSFSIFVTTRLTRPLIALCTLEGLKVSVVPVQTSCPSGAPLTK